MKRFLAAVLLGAMLSCSALAQSVNDANVPAQSGLPLGPEFVPFGGPVCPPAEPILATFSGANTQLGRIFRDGEATGCPGEVYPGIFNPATTYNFEQFVFSNTSAAAACVTINFDPNAGAVPCGTNAHAIAHIGSYDPNNQSANYVGDVGSSVTQPFSVEVPGNSDLVVVVTNTAAAAVCDFAFQVVDLPCDTLGPVVLPDPEIVDTLNWTGLLALIALMAGLGLVVLVRQRGA